MDGTMHFTHFIYPTKSISLFIVSALIAIGVWHSNADANAPIVHNVPGATHANSVCAACHGVNGISVAEHVPHLAGQRNSYLKLQLNAFKQGTRKNALMQAIAQQLSKDDITQLATHFSTLPNILPVANTKSPYLANITKTNVQLPEDFSKDNSRYFQYHKMNESESNQVKHYFANQVAVTAARAGKPLPDGAAIYIESYQAELDADKKPVVGKDGFFVPAKLRSYTTMARESGWGESFPALLRNEEWHYALYTNERKLRTNVNQAECLACHKPESESSYLFTYKELVNAAQRKLGN
jgi:cytochrome c553